MACLLSASKYIVSEYGFTPEYIDEPMFPDPIIPASQAQTLQTLHTLMCCATGEDPTYISARRVVDWVTQTGMAANA